MTSSSRALPPWTQRSIQASQVCNSSTKFNSRVQSSTITTAVGGRAGCGCRKWGTRAVYEGADDGTVYTDSRARMSSSPSSRMSAQSDPTAKSVRGSSFPASAGGSWRRAETRVLFPDEGWPRTRVFFAGIERDEDTELRVLDQRS
ncbi:hypothetical protein V8E53_001590 [Lactarius tabidus]